MEMQQIEDELAYVDCVKITDGVHVIKLCEEENMFEWDEGLLRQHWGCKKTTELEAACEETDWQADCELCEFLNCFDSFGKKVEIS